MSVAQVGTPTAPVGSATSPVTGTWSGSQPRTAGDLLVACATAGSSASTTAISTPAGWTKVGEAVGGNQRVAWYYLVAAGGDAAPSFSSTLGSTPRMDCALFEFTGYDSGGPVVLSGTASAASNTALTVTTSGNVTRTGSYALAAFMVILASPGTTTYSASGSWTNFSNDSGTSLSNHGAFDTQANPATGSTLSDTGTWGTSASNLAGMVIIIPPPAGAGASGPSRIVLQAVNRAAAY